MIQRLLALILSAAALTGCAGMKIPATELHNKEVVNLPTEVHRTAAAKAPTVILLHGCGGIEYGHFQSWIKPLNAWGYNVVVIDSISARGNGSICHRPRAVVTHEQRSADAHDAAQWIIKQPWATEKVGIIGFSHGGGAVLYSAEERFVKANFGQQIIAAGVAFYPYCESNQMWKAVIPVQIHSGTGDTWTPSGFCRDLSKNWKSEFYEYPGATHGFDLVGYNTQSYPDSSGRRHRLIYDRNYTDQARQRTRDFLEKYLK